MSAQALIKVARRTVASMTLVRSVGRSARSGSGFAAEAVPTDTVPVAMPLFLFFTCLVDQVCLHV